MSAVAEMLRMLEESRRDMFTLRAENEQLRQTVAQLGKVDAVRHVETERLRAEAERLKAQAALTPEERAEAIRNGTVALLTALKACVGALRNARGHHCMYGDCEGSCGELVNDAEVDAALALATPLLKGVE